MDLQALENGATDLSVDSAGGGVDLRYSYEPAAAVPEPEVGLLLLFAGLPLLRRR
jgi:hypothetical protein